MTGGSSGIGHALSNVLVRKGASLVLASHRFDRLKKVAKNIAFTFPNSPTPIAMPCDVTKRESVHRLIEKCVNHFGNIDIFINNAGISVYGDTQRTTEEDFQTVFDVNFYGAINCMFEVIPHMKKNGQGLIVNIASVAAIHGIPYLAAYCASKAALVAVSQSLRIELAHSGISIMIVYPDYTQTNIFKREKNVGGAHRPRGPFTPAIKVANAIVKAIIEEKREIFLSARGKALTSFQGLIPCWVDKVMEGMAEKLKD